MYIYFHRDGSHDEEVIMTTVLALCALVVTVLAGWLLVKRYKPVLLSLIHI